MYANSVFVNIACTSSMKGCKFGNNIRVGFDNSAKMFNFLVFLNFVFVQKTLTLHPLYLQWVESNEFHVHRDKTVGIRKQQIEDTMVTKADMVTKSSVVSGVDYHSIFDSL